VVSELTAASVLQFKEGNMQKTILVAIQILLISIISVDLYAQSSKEKKPQTSTVDTWREALPLSEENAPTTTVPEESTDNVERKETAAETERRILELEQRLMESLKVRDSASLGFLIADDFMLAGLDLAGKESDKDRFVKWATSQLNLKSYDVENVMVRVYPATAVVTLKYKRQASIGGAPADGDFTVTNVWVRRDKLWRITSHHISASPKL
jgi:ketosteroid isomerase-like protein